MKVRSQAAAAAAAAALAVASVSAQSPQAYPGDAPLSYTTITVDDCPTASIETMITVTHGVTVPYCPECEHEPTVTPKPTKPAGHTTIYTTTYLSVCETGTVPATYTVTETCDEPEPTWTPGPSHIPQGFTVTVKPCTACEGGHKTKPVQVTVTEPCNCEATHGTSVGPKPTRKPIEQISDGQVQNPGPTPGGDKPAPPGPYATGPAGGDMPAPPGLHPSGPVGGEKPAPPGPHATGPAGGDMPAPPGLHPSGPVGGDDSHIPTGPGAPQPSAAPYPTLITNVKCPGPKCKATGTGVLPPPPADNTSPGEATPPEETGTVPTAYTGAASSPYTPFGFAALSIVVGALAFAL